MLYSNIQVHRSVVTMSSLSPVREGLDVATVTRVFVDPAPLSEISTTVDEASISTKLVHSSPLQVSRPHPTARSPFRMSGPSDTSARLVSTDTPSVF